MAKQNRVIPANFPGKATFCLQTVSNFAGLLHLHINPQTVSAYRIFANITLAAAFLVSLLGLPILYQGVRQHPISEKSPS